MNDVLMGNHLFVIFAVLDVSLAVNLCINCSFFTFINIKTTGDFTHVNLTEIAFLCGMPLR